jgi:hypothetical protein
LEPTRRLATSRSIWWRTVERRWPSRRANFATLSRAADARMIPAAHVLLCAVAIGEDRLKTSTILSPILSG